MALKRTPSPEKLLLARVAFGVGWLSALAVLVVGPAYRNGYADLTAVRQVFRYGAYGGIAAGVLGLAVSLLLPALAADRGGPARLLDLSQRTCAFAGLGGLAAFVAATAGRTLAPDLAAYVRPDAVIAFAAICAMAAVGFGILASLAARRGSGKPGTLSALFGVGLGIAAAFMPLSWLLKAQSVPAIHDIATDTANPPAFNALRSLRGDAHNPPEYPGERAARLQAEFYPEIQPVVLRLPPAEVFARVERRAREAGWRIVAAETAEGRIEATAVTRWFGFKDDIVIRIAATTGGTRLDMRSKSRVGVSDLGANAERIRAFLAGLRD